MHSIPIYSIYAGQPLPKIRDYFQSFGKGCRIIRRAGFLEEAFIHIYVPYPPENINPPSPFSAVDMAQTGEGAFFKYMYVCNLPRI